jgi:fructose-1,6-bisphosphatase/inositol monophosphatase family enzyme
MPTRLYRPPGPSTSQLALAPNWPNSHAAGVLIKEYLRRAFLEILTGSLRFQASDKPGSSFRPRDQVTDIDHRVQLLLLRWLLETFPGTGIIAEEVTELSVLKHRFPDRDLTSLATGHLHVPCAIPGVEFFLIFDPIDGTGAFIRGDLHGVACQIALAVRVKGRVHIIGAFIVDAYTQEIFGFRPGSSRVHRISRFEKSRQLNGVAGREDLHDGIAILRDSVALHSKVVQRMMRPHGKGGLVRTHTIQTGSMALSYASLWCSGAALIAPPWPDTPWDLAPPLGISQRLGYLSFSIIDGIVCPFDYQLKLEPGERPFEVLWVHHRQAAGLYKWCASNKVLFRTWEGVFPGGRPR